ncbi:MAG: hypothetical protein N2115_01065 [bacterium]|nr:hypothetical protein [bacterium]
MIEINLLKARQERFYQKVLLIRILTIYIIGFLCLIMILGVSYLSNRIAIRSVLAGIKKYSEHIEKQQDVVESLKNYKEEMDKISKFLFLGQEELKKRVLWSRKFNTIVNSVPEGISLGRMFLMQNPLGEKTQRVFVIEGSTLPGIEEYSSAISKFMDNIKNNSASEFTTITLVEVRKNDTGKGSQGVIFRIECGLKGE